MSGNSITDAILLKACDTVENSLEKFVFENRGKLFAKGMETHIQVQYEMLLDEILTSNGGKLQSLSESQQEYVKDRIKKTLEISKQEYES